VRGVFDKLSMRQRRPCGCLTDRKMLCVHAAAITVGWINSLAVAQRGAVGAARQGMSAATAPHRNQPPSRTIRTNITGQ